MRQFLALDFIDPYITDIRRPPPDLDAGWLKTWGESKLVAATQEPDCVSVGGGVSSSVERLDPAPIDATLGKPVVAATDGGTWVAMSEEPTEEGVYELRLWRGGKPLFSRWANGQWHLTSWTKEHADPHRRSGDCYTGEVSHWLKPSAPQSPGADADGWIPFSQEPPELGLYEILASGLGRDVQWFSRYFGDGKWSGRHELSDQTRYGSPSYERKYLAVGGGCQYPWTHYRRITKQGN